MLFPSPEASAQLRCCSIVIICFGADEMRHYSRDICCFKEVFQTNHIVSHIIAGLASLVDTQWYVLPRLKVTRQTVTSASHTTCR